MKLLARLRVSHGTKNRSKSRDFAELIFAVKPYFVYFAELNFADRAKKRENKFRENFYPRKLVPLRYWIFSLRENHLETPGITKGILCKTFAFFERKILHF